MVAMTPTAAARRSPKSATRSGSGWSAAKRAAALMARIRRVSGTAVTEITPSKEGSVPLWKQGAAELYTDDAVLLRTAARADPRVRD